jgi:hypothetical protein
MIVRLSSTTAAFAILLFAAGPAAALDLNKLDRRIAKEPTYQSKPLYGLALIGPSAETRVWMVLEASVCMWTRTAPPARFRRGVN